MPRNVWTPQQAREFAAKGNLIRWSRKPSPTPIKSESPAITEALAEDYQGRVLLRVRAQLDLVLDEIDKELRKAKLDHSRLKILNETQCRLAELERKLSMRPEPGSLKPRQDRSRTNVAPQPARPGASQTPQQVDTCGHPERINPPITPQSNGSV